MNIQEITLKKASGLYLKKNKYDNYNHALTIMSNIMSLGFVFTPDMLEVLRTKSTKRLTKLQKEIVPVLQEIVGADVVYSPMYPNFPSEVIEASDEALYTNAILHYMSGGTNFPDVEKLSRPLACKEICQFKFIDALSKEDCGKIFTRLVSSNSSLSDYDNKVLDFFLASEWNVKKYFPADDIEYKEILCKVAKYNIENGIEFKDLVKNSTDVLRIITALSDGDISLSERCKFKSLKRAKRKQLTLALEAVVSTEDLNRHKEKWVKAAHSLHVGDYSKKVFACMKKLRENMKIETFNSKVELAIKDKDIQECLNLLNLRPGEFARRLDEVLRTFPKKHSVIFLAFVGITDKVSTSVLLQLYGHFGSRDEGHIRVALPKGQVQHALKLPSLANLGGTICSDICIVIRATLSERFGEKLGDDAEKRVFISDELKGCPIPAQMRSTSDALETYTRGTRLPIDKSSKALRFFIYWKGNDIDLSATMYDKDFTQLGRVSYTQLKNVQLKSCHSGDITYAPEGASEFIDVEMEGFLKGGARYVAMNVLVYSGPTFKEHEICYAGWMERAEVNSGEIYDPKTVKQKFNVVMDSKNCIPVIFDLETMEAIITDLPTSENSYSGGNNVESNSATIKDKMIMVNSLSDIKPTIYDLLTFHALGRNQVIVPDAKNADVVYDISFAKEINTINSEFVV